MLCYEDIEQTSVEWLWFPYIPFGKLTIIQGNPGEGKTYFAMMLTAACTNRKLFPNMEDIEPFNVIYQTAEDGMGDTIFQVSGVSKGRLTENIEKRIIITRGGISHTNACVGGVDNGSNERLCCPSG